jgi:UDP-N-acetylmuramoylalanine--D-glutamate ligase
MIPGVTGPGRAAVLGLALSGIAAATALAEEGLTVRAADEGDAAVLAGRAASLQALGVELRAGAVEPDWLLDGAGLLVPSPGVPPANPVVRAARKRGIPVWSEIELGWRFARGPVVAVTGTNGKTTTTTLVGAMLGEAGIPAVTAGNIGTPLTEVARRAVPGTVLVCEVSSFQLAFVESFRPRVAIVLNVADDHYDWHGGPGDYLSAKARVTAFQQAGDLLVVRAGDPGCATIAAASRARLAGFAVAPPGAVRAELAGDAGRPVALAAGVEGGAVVVDGPGGAEQAARAEHFSCADIRLIRSGGPHNIENVAAAATAALEAGAGREAVARALAAFGGLPHRTTLVAEVNGVRYVDDSKATNPHATLRALAGYDRVVLIAGGRSKGMDLSPLAAEGARVAGVVVMGEAAGQLAGLFGPKVLGHAGSVEEAVTIAAGHARPGETVLLSPACSSLDQYSSYAERGDRFARAVGALAGSVR